MRVFGRWLGHILRGMVQGCLTLALIAAALSTGAAFLLTPTHQFSRLDLVFILSISIVSGLLGAVALLAWRLSHIEELAHIAKDVSQHAMHAPDAREK